jgi:hypothetical protein
LGFCASLVVSQLIRLRAYAGIVWLPIFALCLWLARDVVAVFVKPLEPFSDANDRPRSALRQNVTLFLAIWAGTTFTLVGYIYILAWIAFFIGASHRDIIEISDMASYPLAWINPWFIVRVNKTFAVVAAISAGNSIFYAVALTACFKIVRRAFRRSRVIELSIKGTAVGAEDDDF